MVIHKETNGAILTATFLPALTCLFIATLMLPSVYAEESIVDVVTIDVPVSCSMSATGNNSHNATVQNGATVSDIGTTNIKVICNDDSGYAIYAIGYTDDTYGKTVLTSSALGSTHDIITSSTVTTGTSSWAMKLASQTGTYAPTIVTDFASYHAVPQEYTKVAYLTSSTDTGNNATGSNFTTTYRTYISQTQPAGTYVGQVKYTLVHPNMNDDSNKPVTPLAATDCPANSICYAPNASDIVGSMDSINVAKITSSPTAGKQTQTVPSGPEKVDITSNSKAQLIAPNYSRPGYGFAGWSTEWDATTATNPTIYGPNETITVPDVSENGLILYPVWIASAGNLQGADGQGWTGCSSLTTATYNSTTGKVEATLSSITALKDTRDNNVYVVAKLADGNCWMVENLRLNAENTRGDANKAKAQGYGDATDSAQGNLGKFIGLADSEMTDFRFGESKTDVTAANSIYYAGTQSGTATINIMQDYYAGSRIPRYNNNNTNRSLTASYNGGGRSIYYHWYGYGNYYSWPAAMANTGNYTNYGGNPGSDIAGTSICPKGWKLPLGDASSGDISQGESLYSNRVGSFSYLDRKLGGSGDTTGTNASGIAAGTAQSERWRSFPVNLVYSGEIDGEDNEISSVYGRGSNGYYWTSSASGSNFAYHVLFGKNHIRPGTGSTSKYDGYSVRCIAQ